MAYIPPKNGNHVTARSVNWATMVQDEWGEEWRKPDIAYEMSGGAKKECTDQFTSGFYNRTIIPVVQNPPLV